MGRRMAHQPIPSNPALFSKLYVSLQVSPLVHACVSKEQATPHLLQSFNVCVCVCVKEQRLRGEISWTNSSMEPTHKNGHTYTHTGGAGQLRERADRPCLDVAQGWGRRSRQSSLNQSSLNEWSLKPCSTSPRSTSHKCITTPFVW